mmetsp:Transcript_27348/g.50149  ORF Transcript_27348/g.50149 Transcript_27348/m.50149 type:complete len:139 (+) Transcript_27348:117-533(+)
MHPRCMVLASLLQSDHVQADSREGKKPKVHNLLATYSIAAIASSNLNRRHAPARSVGDLAGEELSLKAVKSVNTSFTLGSSTSQLEAQLASVQLLRQACNGFYAQVLQAMFQALTKIRHVLVDRTLVLHSSGDTLGHL